MSIQQSAMLMHIQMLMYWHKIFAATYEVWSGCGHVWKFWQIFGQHTLIFSVCVMRIRFFLRCRYIKRRFPPIHNILSLFSYVYCKHHKIYNKHELDPLLKYFKLAAKSQQECDYKPSSESKSASKMDSNWNTNDIPIINYMLWKQHRVLP